MKRDVTALLVLYLLFLPLLYSAGRETSLQEEYVFSSRIGESHHKQHQTSLSVSDRECLNTNIWLLWDNQSQSCHCGSDVHEIVYCHNKWLSVINCYCLTVEYTKNGGILPVVGNCALTV